MKTFLSLVVGTATCTVLSGCLLIGGSRTTTEAPRGPATLGQQLVDLAKARDNGAITQAEFDKLKAELLKKERERPIIVGEVVPLEEFIFVDEDSAATAEMKAIPPPTTTGGN